MSISKEEILHIAKLASLNIRDDEIEEYSKDLQDILNFVNVINKVKTDNIVESIGTLDNSNVFREDEIDEFGNRDILLQNAPEQEKGMFKIPRVI